MIPLPDKFKRYPFITWAFVVATFLVVVYTLSPEWVRALIDRIINKLLGIE